MEATDIKVLELLKESGKYPLISSAYRLMTENHMTPSAHTDSFVNSPLGSDGMASEAHIPSTESYDSGESSSYDSDSYNESSSSESYDSGESNSYDSDSNA